MKIICVGRNYSEHIAELNNERAKDPVLFLKPETAILLKKQPFFIPDFSENVHHEIEVCVRINRLGKNIAPQFARKYYSEVTVGLDFTARDLQSQLKEKGLPWEKAKAFDGSAAIGKWVPLESVGGDINNLNFSLEKDNETAQSGNTSQMITPIDELISYISTFFTLKIGDVIFTGTPAGVSQILAGNQLKGFLEGEQLLNISVK
jgi:2-keto-4-pentenoate hydratase/2-oxohepta-3-ene-1,7-dioic acid hydratase in catechol pathway